jgi:hypothetical protein
MRVINIKNIVVTYVINIDTIGVISKEAIQVTNIGNILVIRVVIKTTTIWLITIISMETIVVTRKDY